MTENWKFYLVNPHDGNRQAHRRSATSSQIGEDYFCQEDNRKLTVFDLVYNYLRKCADRDTKRKQRKCACNKFQKQHARRRDICVRDVPIPRNIRRVFHDNSTNRLKLDKNISAKKSLEKKRRCIIDDTSTIQYGSECAKCYIKQALLYGLQSGLLIPIGQRNVLRISRKLRNICLPKKT